MLRCAVLGEQPPVTLRGRSYQGTVATPAFGALSSLRSIGQFLSSLALFHSSLDNALSQETPAALGVGGMLREKPVVSRRLLLSFLEYLSSPLTNDEPDSWVGIREALVRYYVERAVSEERETVVRLLDAAGIGPNTWILD